MSASAVRESPSVRPGAEVRWTAVGTDPVWVLWAEWAHAHRLAFAVRPAPAAGPGGTEPRQGSGPTDRAGAGARDGLTDGPTVGTTAGGPEVAVCPGEPTCPDPGIVVVSPWDEPGPEVVARAVSEVHPGARTDVWLVCSDPSPQLRARVLAAGGRGCLPRLPDSRALSRVEGLASWWPEQAPHTGLGTAPDPAAGLARTGPPGFELASPPVSPRWLGGGPRIGTVVAAARATLAAAARRWGAPVRTLVGRMGGGITALLSVRPWTGGAAFPPPSAAPAPWWAWPTAAGPGSPLVVVWPPSTPVDLAERALAEWLAARRLGPSAARPIGAVPAPAHGREHPGIRRAAAAPAVAVVAAPDWPTLSAVRTLVAALAAAGARQVRVWIVAQGAERELRPLAMALGAPCSFVPTAAGAQAPQVEG